MTIEKVSLVYFSPTSTTRLVLEAVSEGVGAAVSGTVDITLPAVRKEAPPAFRDELLLLGAPVYAGRLPVDAAGYFKRIRADNCLAVPIVLYGNRAYDDALLELTDIAEAAGCLPVAAGAFIGEHSFSGGEFRIAENRPDKADLEEARGFGEAVSSLLNRLENISEVSSVKVPGNRPYRELMPHRSFPFIEVTEDCDDCGICVAVCPNNAIDESAGYATVDDLCIHCCACIKACPPQARVMKECPLKDIARKLNRNCTGRRAPETFFSSG